MPHSWVTQGGLGFVRAASGVGDMTARRQEFISTRYRTELASLRYGATSSLMSPNLRCRVKFVHPSLIAPVVMGTRPSPDRTSPVSLFGLTRHIIDRDTLGNVNKGDEGREVGGAAPTRSVDRERPARHVFLTYGVVFARTGVDSKVKVFQKGGVDSG